MGAGDETVAAKTLPNRTRDLIAEPLCQTESSGQLGGGTLDSSFLRVKSTPPLAAAPDGKARRSLSRDTHRYFSSDDLQVEALRDLDDDMELDVFKTPSRGEVPKGVLLRQANPSEPSSPAAVSPAASASELVTFASVSQDAGVVAESSWPWRWGWTSYASSSDAVSHESSWPWSKVFTSTQSDQALSPPSSGVSEEGNGSCGSTASTEASTSGYSFGNGPMVTWLRGVWDNYAEGTGDPGHVPKLQAKTAATAPGFRRMIGGMEWLYADAAQIVDEMLPGDSEPVVRREFELSDLLQAAAKTSDLSIYLSSLPTFFWIFIIVLVYNIVNVAKTLMDLWLDAIIYHFGFLAQCILLGIVMRSWPVFIWYLAQTFSYAREVMELHQRTVQFYGMPPSLCNYQTMTDFCEDRKLRFTSIHLPPGVTSGELKHTQGTFVVEAVCESVNDLQEAFKNERLTPHVKMNGVWVRVRPKIGKNTAQVEWWLVCFEFLNDNVSGGYWRRASLSCLITMSLMKHLSETVIWAYSAVEASVGVVGVIGTKVCMFISLIFMLFFVGHHSYVEILDAYRDMQLEEMRLAGDVK